jgi:sigma-B regulation protein RsbU (phosphoserine phosphatase)
LARLERPQLRRQQTDEFERIQDEFSEAKLMQSILLPRPELLEQVKSEMNLDIAYSYEPASELAGDYLSVRHISDTQIAIISADVAGHGVTAALYAFALHALSPDNLIKQLTPHGLLMHLNIKLNSLMGSGKFSTIFLGIIDTEKRIIRYSAAASPPPILLSDGQPNFLDTRGFLLGIDAKSVFDLHEVAYKPGDTLLLYSDALTETQNKSGELIDETVVVKIMNMQQYNTSESLCSAILEHYKEDITRIQKDDLSLLACKF